MPQHTSIDPALLQRAAAVIKCLGHPLRLGLLDELEGGAETVSQLQTRTGATQSTISQQLAILRGHGVVSAQRDGPFVRYHIAEPKVHAILACIRGCGALENP